MSVHKSYSIDDLLFLIHILEHDTDSDSVTLREELGEELIDRIRRKKADETYELRLLYPPLAFRR